MKKFAIIIASLISITCWASQPLECGNRTGVYKRVFYYPGIKLAHSPQKCRASNVAVALPSVRLTRTFPPIDSIFIRGGITLDIIGGEGKNKIATPAAYPGLSVKVCDCAMYISNNQPVACNPSCRPRVTLYLNQPLQRLVVAGDNCITGRCLNTCCGLGIEHCGGGTVCLDGPTQVTRIANSGSAAICIPCVTSRCVQVLATRCSNTKLAGRTEVLLIRAFQQANVDTRFMCSRIALVQAANEALVTVKTTQSLKAFAADMSNIYYYTTPDELRKHNILSGNVFQMGDW